MIKFSKILSNDQQLKTLNFYKIYKISSNDFNKKYKNIFKKILSKLFLTYFKLKIIFKKLFLKNLKMKINMLSVKNISKIYIFEKNIIMSKNHKKDFLKSNLLIFSYKTQLRSVFIFNNKISFSITNGEIVKKLELEKSQKKNDKITMLNLNEMLKNFNHKKNNNSCIITLQNTTSKLNKIISFLRKKFKNENLLYFYNPKISYSYSKVKKIKSIKRKLSKKYVKIKNK